ncbi:MAG: DUF3800 domain-containing protein [Candidatus Paralactobacillus gallistercoris]|uniref:DUF3800 domain-containing protein n=1 Tax=Candidatus Paralactobacillus gallistercoris TaxID=2838724 RepID=A0A948X0F3_9LACO|nr:DUF3800 domain-containing protein [Candidatus Paralactobacillus gallistercoris]
MNKAWRNRPTKIDEVDKKINYIIAMDESGTPTLKGIQRKIKNNEQMQDNDRFFTLSACAFNVNNFYNAKDEVMKIKNKYWPDGKYQNARVCFHATEIKRHNRNTSFDLPNDTYNLLVNDIKELLHCAPMKIFSATIDKYKHVEKYAFEYSNPKIKPYYPYDLCVKFLLERLMMFLKPRETCVIILEARGKKEDKELLYKIKDIIDHGSGYLDSSRFNKIQGVYFNPKWNNSNKEKSYWELELADLCCFAINHHFFNPNNIESTFINIEPKLYEYPNYMGKGLKFFPK